MIAPATGVVVVTTGNDNKPPQADKDDKAKKDGKDGADQAGGFAKSFDQYEYVAVITPGAALLLGLLLIFPDFFPIKGNADSGLGSLGIFLVAAYVTGHILRALADVAEHHLWRCIGGMPSEWILIPEPPTTPSSCQRLLPKRGTLLDAQQMSDLGARVRVLFAVELSACMISKDDDDTARSKKFEAWQAVTRRINILVVDAKKSARVEAFNRTYGMMAGITIALVIVGLALCLKGLFGAPFSLVFLSLIAFGLAGFTGYRAFLFGKYYARELYVSFLEVTKPSVT